MGEFGGTPVRGRAGRFLTVLLQLMALTFLGACGAPKASDSEAGADTRVQEAFARVDSFSPAPPVGE